MTETAHTPLPCPFCGGPAEKYECAMAQIHSFGCADENECASAPSSGTFPTEAEALTAWNTRADSHHRLVEALGRMIEIAHAYGEYISQVPSAELERHPYLPGLEDEINDARAALKEAGRG